jgi:hypothetical protein
VSLPPFVRRATAAQAEGADCPGPFRGTRAARFGERSHPDLTPQDLRFTTKGSTLYAFVMGWPEGDEVSAGHDGVAAISASSRPVANGRIMYTKPCWEAQNG